MPKRSNRFQKIVTYIAEQLAPFGATVRESVELPERGLDGVLREVDTLVEMGAGQDRVRIAIESRDHSRKSGIQWVDELIGRYARLGIDLVVGISNAGFSAAAKRKAKAHLIELLSPQDVTSTDWPSTFQKIGIASVVGRLDMTQIEFHTTPPFTGKVSLDDRGLHDTGSGSAEEGTVRDFVEHVRPTIVARVQNYLRKNFLTLYKTLEDLQKTAVADWTLPVNGLRLLTGTSAYVIDKVSVRVVVHNERTITPVRHRVLGDDALLSSGQIGDLELVMAQTAGAQRGKVFLQRAIIPKRGGKGQNRRRKRRTT